ncbi:hypothetical protein CCH79_00020330 [Gambusia affinis]|uniref:Uncharacterized protein n=1 Tax=Gambusia affinis TaxID=33528 RepID=A0A315VSY9_GAMAF|nr:hypothetical protein CCH79_00020330 [Gambusia affinis]
MPDPVLVLVRCEAESGPFQPTRRRAARLSAAHTGTSAEPGPLGFFGSGPADRRFCLQVAALEQKLLDRAQEVERLRSELVSSVLDPDPLSPEPPTQSSDPNLGSLETLLRSDSDLIPSQNRTGSYHCSFNLSFRPAPFGYRGNKTSGSNGSGHLD